MRATLAFSFLLLAPAAAWAHDASRPIQASVPRAGVRRVVVDLPAGEFTVRNATGDRISINGRVERDNDDAELLEGIHVEIEVHGTEAVIRRKLTGEARGWRGRNLVGYDVRIEVPRGVDLVFETRFGEIDLDGSFGDITVDLRAGEIELRTPRADVRELRASVRVGEVTTNLGDRRIQREGIFPGSTHFLNENGKSTVSLHTTAGEVSVRLVD